eukprot:2233698-Rhodomonas_salina.1
MSETKASRKHKLDADGTGKNEHKRLCRKDSHEVCHSDIHLNPHLDFLEAADRLYHLGLDSAMDLPALFGDLRLVVMCGSGDRAESIAEYLVPVVQAAQTSANKTEAKKPPVLGLGKKERYALFKPFSSSYERSTTCPILTKPDVLPGEARRRRW